MSGNNNKRGRRVNVMMKTLFRIILFFVSASLSGQVPVGSWSDHLPWGLSYCLAAGNDKVFSSTGSAILIMDNKYNEKTKLSKINGLTETGINAMAWSDEEKTLVTVYASANVDLVKNGVVTNIPDIKNKYIPGLKEIYNVIVNGSEALLSGSFGIVVIDLNGRYVKDTWRPGPDGETNIVYETAILGGRFYAATQNGVYSAPVNRSGLSYFGNWDRVAGLPSPDAQYNMIAASATSLFVNKKGTESIADSLFRIVPGQAAQHIFSRNGTNIRSADPSSSGVAVTLSSSIIIFSNEGTITREISGYGWAQPNARQTLTADGVMWIADASNGLISTSDFTTFTNHTLPGPYYSNVADIYFSGGRTFVTGGTVNNAWGNVYRPFQVFVRSGTDWEDIILYGQADRDAMRIAADPGNGDHFFASSWGNGIYEFQGKTLLNNYNQYNSPLSSIIPGEAHTRICGLSYDRHGNLWMTQTGVPGNLKVLMKDGSWKVTNVNLNVPAVGDMIIADNDFIWVILPRGYGLLVYDPADTPGDISDDRQIVLQVEDDDGNVMNNLFSIAEDNEGNIWVGTDMGPVVYYAPERVFDHTTSGTRVKVPRNDGSGLADYLLGTETITSVAIDGANRKWFGTMSSGAYLVSEDGREQLLNFNTRNSPIFSDNIVKISIDGKTGDVWFGTANGIASFRGDATSGNDDYSGIYVFPNPVREDFEGMVTVTGLMESSTVKITDITGNLVFETTSNGGQASWDLINYRGKRVNTGVYLVFVTNSDGTVSAVTKFLVIH